MCQIRDNNSNNHRNFVRPEKKKELRVSTSLEILIQIILEFRSNVQRHSWIFTLYNVVTNFGPIRSAISRLLEVLANIQCYHSVCFIFT